MLHKYLSIPGLTLLLIVALAGCGATEMASPLPTDSPSDTPLPASDMPPPTATATASILPPSPSPSPLPPSPTPTTPPSPTSPPASDTPSPVTSPTASPTPQPTATPTPPGSARIDLALQPVVGGLDRPVGLAQADDGSGRLFVVEKAGRIRVVQAGSLVPQPFLDIVDRVGSSQSEQGLLGLAFHPDYAANGLLFVNYTDRQGNTVVARFSQSPDPARAEPGSEYTILILEQPAANHNGGHLAFGPDGYLYVGTGDGGGANDRYGHGQNGATLLGAMLRLDVDGDQPYAVPADNPFVGDPGVRDEIWAIGLRNPWRFSFDRATGDLYIADVGQNTYEEIDFQPAASPGGQNYGWPIMEGRHCFPANQACEQAGLTQPVHEYDHSQGCSVTGGYVYRGPAFPELDGVYLLADFCSGKIWGLAPGGAGQRPATLLAETDLSISSFGQDEAGELYLVDMQAGRLFQIVLRSR